PAPDHRTDLHVLRVGRNEHTPFSATQRAPARLIARHGGSSFPPGGTAMFRFRFAGARVPLALFMGAIGLGWAMGLAACDGGGSPGVSFEPQEELDATERFAVRMVQEGRQIFRHDTFGSEAFWGDTLRLHEAIAGQANGGVGDGLTPATAL